MRTKKCGMRKRLFALLLTATLFTQFIPFVGAAAADYVTVKSLSVSSGNASVTVQRGSSHSGGGYMFCNSPNRLLY